MHQLQCFLNRRAVLPGLCGHRGPRQHGHPLFPGPLGYFSEILCDPLQMHQLQCFLNRRAVLPGLCGHRGPRQHGHSPLPGRSGYFSEFPYDLQHAQQHHCFPNRRTALPGLRGHHNCRRSTDLDRSQHSSQHRSRYCLTWYGHHKIQLALRSFEGSLHIQ